MSLFRKGLLLLTVAIAFQIMLLAVLIASHNACSRGVKQFEHCLNFTSGSSSVLLSFFELRQILVNQSMMTLEIDSLLQRVLKTVTELDQQHLQYNPDTLGQSLHLRDEIAQCVQILQETREKQRKQALSGKQPTVPWNEMHRMGAIMSEETNDLSRLFIEEQANVARLIEQQKSDSQTTLVILYTGMALELLLIAFSIFWYMQSTTPKIASVMRNIERLSQRQALNEPIAGDDELSKLDQIFHSMATALADARRSQRDLMDRQRDVICRLDEHLSFKQINPACHASFGFMPEELIGKSIADLLQTQRADDGPLQQFQSAKSGNGSAFETRISRRDRSTIEMLVSISWLEHDRSFVCVMHDITSQKRAERLRQELLQMISHDLRTPLTTVSGTFEIFEEFGISGQAMPLLERGKSAAAQMSSLVDHFLKIEKIKAGMFDLDLEPGPLQPILNAAAANARIDRAALAAASLKINPTTIEIVCDRQRLEETFTDLFLIALETAAPTGQISVSTNHSDKDTVLISISATSAPTGDQDSQREQSVLSRLALPLCQLIIEQHGGTLTQEPTSLAIRLPLNSQEPEVRE